MPKTLVEAQITTPNARSKLRAGGPHWRLIAPGIHLGYRPVKRGGYWVARWYLGSGKYNQQKLGIANDGGIKADGVYVLDFDQAEAAARRAVQSGFLTASAEADGGIKTVRSAVEKYGLIRDRTAQKLQGRVSVRSDFSRRMAKHVMNSKLADKPLHILTVEDLTSWILSLPGSLRASTIQRTLNDLRAALNDAGRIWQKQLPIDYSATVQNGLSLKNAVRDLPSKQQVDEFADVESQIITDEEVRRIVAASAEVDSEKGWDGDLHRMVALLATTGLRLSQLARCQVADVDVPSGTIVVPPSRKGIGQVDSAGKIPRRIAPAMVDLLKPVLNRKRNAILLERVEFSKDGYTWRATGDRRAWRTTDISKPWKLIIAHAKVGSHLTPYCLRHSAIVRMIMMNAPTLIVAKRHNTSVSMIEKHYSRYIAIANPEREDEIFRI